MMRLYKYEVKLAIKPGLTFNCFPENACSESIHDNVLSLEYNNVSSLEYANVSSMEYDYVSSLEFDNVPSLSRIGEI